MAPRPISLTLVVLVVTSCLLLGSGNASAQGDLVEEYAPILYFHPDEECYPVEVDYYLGSSALYLYDDGPSLISDSSLPILGQSFTADHYLDNLEGDVEDKGIVEAYGEEREGLGYTVYSRVQGQGDRTVIQYWLFYVFNDGPLNRHEGDWEMVQVMLDGGEPVGVMYSQHHGGQRAEWSQVSRSGDHVRVYVAEGSHANYFRPFSGVAGIASDAVSDDGRVLGPEDYRVEDLAAMGWVDYQGRWGEYGGWSERIQGEVGPYGPAFRQEGRMWDALGWEEELVSAHDGVFMLEWLLSNIYWIVGLLTALVLAYHGHRIYRRHQREGLGPRVSSLLYVNGMDPRSVANVLCAVGVVIVVIGLFLPWYVASADVGIEGLETAGREEVVVLDGIDGISVNFLRSDGAITPLGSLVFPFSLFVAIGLLFLLVSTVGEREARKVGKEYASRGLGAVTPIILTLMFVALLSLVSTALLEDLAMTDEAEGLGIERMVETISSRPWGGSEEFSLQGAEADTVHLSWGLGAGAYLLILGGALMMVAGVVMYREDGTLYEPREAEGD